MLDTKKISIYLYFKIRGKGNENHQIKSIGGSLHQGS